MILDWKNLLFQRWQIGTHDKIIGMPFYLNDFFFILIQVHLPFPPVYMIIVYVVEIIYIYIQLFCLISAPVAMVIASQQDASFVFMALAIVFCCFLSMLLIFVPKVCIFFCFHFQFIYFYHVYVLFWSWLYHVHVHCAMCMSLIYCWHSTAVVVFD